MDAFISKIMEHIAQQGLSLAFSVIAVIFLWNKIKECESDRKALWERLLSMSENNNK